jgi:hypothetical protein
MPMTAAERQRKRRQAIRCNEKLNEEYKDKERKRWHERVAAKRAKLIGDMSDREKRYKRAKWRRSQKKLRQSRTSRQKANNSGETEAQEHKYCMNTDESRQKQLGRRNIKRTNRQAYRTINSLQAKLQNMQRRCRKYEKRLQRLKGTQASGDTPRSRTRHLLRSRTSRSLETVGRTLVFHHALINSIRE